MDEAAELAERLRPAVRDERVLAAIGSVPREHFVSEAERRRAYENVALPIGYGQTISQPLVVGRMLALLQLRATDRVLDIGTGSGYHAALLALLVEQVWTIERHADLSRQAEQRIRELGIENVSFVLADGWGGLPDMAPFDAINVAAATGEAIPAALEAQLAEGGRLLAPVGTKRQHLVLTRRGPRGFRRSKLEAVRFVPLLRGLAQ